MKEYIKPTIEIVELRPEERLAGCNFQYKHSTLAMIILSMIFGWCTRCKRVSSGSKCGS